MKEKRMKTHFVKWYSSLNIFGEIALIVVIFPTLLSALARQKTALVSGEGMQMTEEAVVLVFPKR
jgi:hypothetical protein